jgi:hypothetical protein
MAILDFLSALWGVRHVAPAASEVVDQVFERSWCLVCERVSRMGEAEAKGYTRARTGTLVAEQVVVVLARHPKLGKWARKELHDHSMELLADQIWHRTEQIRSSRTSVRRAA